VAEGLGVIDTTAALFNRVMGATGTTDSSVEEVQVMRAAQKDLRHFSAIYDRYFPRIYAYCLRRVSGPQEAEDLTSQIFTRAMVNIEQYRGGFVAAWLFRIAHNVVATHMTSAAARARDVSLDALSAEVEAQTIDPIDEILQAEDAQVLDRIVAHLTREQQELLRLRIIEGLSSETIAAHLGKQAGAVRVTLHRIFRRLYGDYEQAMAGKRHG